MSTSVTPATNTTTETSTASTPVSVPQGSVPQITIAPTPTPVPVQNTTSETPVTQAVPTVPAVPVPTTTTEIKKDNSNNVEKGIVHTVIQGIFVFIIALLVIGLIGYYLFSREEDAFRFRELFFPHRELVPKI
jgi:hypothetical protein